MSLLRLAVRYRFSSGLRQAMSLWSGLIVAYALAVGLKAEPPIVLWGHQWAASPNRLVIAAVLMGALIIATRPLLHRALRGYGDDLVQVLPIERRTRLMIDGTSAALFLLLPLSGLIGVAGIGSISFAFELVPLSLLAVLAALALLGKSGQPRLQATGRALPLPNELRWLLRVGGIPGAQLLALACVAGAELAIRNNHVQQTMSIRRIEFCFAALAATSIATAMTRARKAMRSFRQLEIVLPVTAVRRVSTLLFTSIAAALPVIALFAFLRPGGLIEFVPALALLVLAGDEGVSRARSGEGELIGYGIAAAVVGAIDPRFAMAATLILLPLAWQRAIRADGCSDLMIVPEAL